MALYSTRRKIEMEESLAHIQDLQRAERLAKFLRSLFRIWPIALGVLLGCFAPDLRDLVSLLPPWGMWLVFPFVVISERPELHMGATVARILPVIALYAQFPIEGLLARIAVRPNVALPEVTRQMFFYHFLGATELVLVSGALNHLMMR